MSDLDTTPEERGPIRWMAGHGVAANLLMLCCLIGGGIAFSRMKQELFPDIQRDEVRISISLPGASPEEVETGAVLAIEDAVEGLEGVKQVDSSVYEGGARVQVEALLGTNLQRLADDIESAIDRITTFPEEAEEPEVELSSWRPDVLELVLHGPAEPEVLHELAERTRGLLLEHPDITLIELEDLPDLEIAIEVPQEHLRRLGLDLGAIATRLRAASVERSGGAVDTAEGEILVRVTERRDWGAEFARLPILTTAGGAQVLLGDIASIHDGFEDTDRYTLYNGRPAISMEVFRVGNQTPIQVANAVRSLLPEVEAELPAGIETAIHNDHSEYFRERIELLVKNLSLGLILVLCLLGIFLEARLAFWVMMGIPISFLGSFLFLPMTGATINMMSLFAYIIALGIVVDDAIVVGENVYHHHQEGMPMLRAAVRGTREVVLPVTFSILTNCVAFLPILFIPGTTGKIFAMIPIVVCVVFLISLVECLFILPAHLGHQRERRRRGPFAWLHDWQQAFSHGFRTWIRERFGPFLALTLHHRLVVIALAISILATALAYAWSGRMGFGLFPVIESDRADVEVVLPFGAPVEKTERIMQRMLAGAREVIAESGRPELVEEIITDIGRGGSHQGRMRIELAPPAIRDEIMSTTEFTEHWRKRVGEVTGVEYVKFSADSGGPGGRGRAVAVQLNHRRIPVLEEASKELAARLAEYPRVKDIDDGFQSGKPQLDFTLTPTGERLGLTADAISRQVRNAFYGARVVRQQRGRNEITVRVRLPEAERSTAQTIDDLMIRAPTGVFVPLAEVATYERGRAFTSINRRRGNRVIEVSGDVIPRSQAGEVLADLRTSVLPGLMDRYPGLSYSFEGRRAAINESMGSLQVTFVLALLAIYALLAIPFRSYLQPLIVMISIPFGIVGAIAGHLIMGFDLCIPSMFGIVALSGVVVNDSLVLVDHANRRRREDGLDAREAAIAAGIQRFRPVLLTTLTTFGGLSPMIFETSRQARFLIPMALSLGFGILFATLITLILVPTLYLTFADLTGLFRRSR